jgi:hypothetical protein
MAAGHKKRNVAYKKWPVSFPGQDSSTFGAAGGLLVAVQEEGAEAFEGLLRQQGFPARFCRSFGRLGVRTERPLISVVEG